jgi:hypothetical protein
MIDMHQWLLPGQQYATTAGLVPIPCDGLPVDQERGVTGHDGAGTMPGAQDLVADSRHRAAVDIGVR